MKLIRLIPLVLATLSPLLAEDPPEISEPALVEKESSNSRIVVLGYHEFTTTPNATEMRLPTSKLRKQLQEIKDNKLNVITLADFIAWKKGEKDIPDKSILITIDDGWKSVYTDAYPIFKEFNFPFTIYLYKNYVDGGGRALTTPMINEMLESNLCTIGSHSVSHPFPSKIKKQKKRGSKAFDTFLDLEFGSSKKFLEDKFKQDITTYAYPGGFHTEEMFDTAKKHNYDFLFTVVPGKVKLETQNNLLPRYIILGTHDYIFKNAITFRNLASQTPDLAKLEITTPHPVQPAPATAVASRTPTILADLSAVTDLNPKSIEMRVAGFGKVPYTFDSETKTCSWEVNRPLRSNSVEVIVSWKLDGKTKSETPMKWTFLIDKTAEYQPRKNSEETSETQETAPTE